MKRRIADRFIKIALLIVISCAVEVFVFNFGYFRDIIKNYPKSTIASDSFTYNESCVDTGSTLAVYDNGEFSLTPSKTAVNSVKINTFGSARFKVSVYYIDDTSQKTEKILAQQTVDTGVAGTDYIRLNSYGNVSKMRFIVTEAVGAPQISSIELNTPRLGFNLIRTAIVFLLLLFAMILKRQKLWDKKLDLKSTVTFDTIVILFILAGFVVIELFTGSSLTNGFSVNVGTDGDCYRLLTEAFANGSFSFLQNPPEQLSKLSNPYDPSLRDFSFIFDSAFYNGKYYCYFGIAPVITLLLPFKLITGLYLPTTLACFFFMILLLFALLLFYYNIVSTWYKNISYMQFLGGAIVVLFGANLFWLMARPMFYELAVLSALANLFLGFSLLLSVYRKGNHRYLKLFLCGLFFALSVASRPTYLIYIVVSLVFLICLVFNKDEKKRYDYKAAVSFIIIPILLGGFIMYYNAARFGSAFNFGQRYQLTISDIRYNSVFNFGMLPAAIFHYLFAPLKIDAIFPFFHIQATAAITSSGFYYNQPLAGLFNFPIMLITLISPSILKRMSAEKKDLKRMAIGFLITAAVIIYLNMTLAGVLERYMLDIMPLLAVVSVILWFELIEIMQKRGSGSIGVKIFFAVCIVTAVISFLCSTAGEYNTQIINCPERYERLSQIFEIYR